MQISKINSTNFKGLWEIKEKKCDETAINYGSEIYYREAIYHPFKDESYQHTQYVVEREMEHPVYECDDMRVQDPYGPDHYIITKHTVGKKLDITMSQYLKAKSLEEIAHPVSEGYLHYTISDDRRSPIRKIMNENGIKE